MIKQQRSIPTSIICSNNVGQAVIEYLLVMIVIVSIAIGLLYQFSGSFSRWATAYFGSYFSCLLETGELPGIGGSGNDSGICSQLYEPFTFTAGVPPISGGKKGNPGDGQNRTPSTGRDENKSRFQGDQSRYMRANTKNALANQQGRINNSFSNSNNNNNKGQSSQKNSNKLYTGSTQTSLGSFVQSQRKDDGQKIKISSWMSALGLKSDKDDQRKEKISIAGKNDSSLGKGRDDKIRINRKVATKEQNLNEGEMTFGNFFRLLIIAAIVIALLVLLGGQGLQISKSWD